MHNESKTVVFEPDKQAGRMAFSRSVITAVRQKQRKLTRERVAAQITIPTDGESKFEIALKANRKKQLVSDGNSFEQIAQPETSKMRAFLRIKAPGNDDRTICVGQDEFVIGRSPNYDLQIRDDNISRKHVKITLNDSQPFIEDLGSTNGTFINSTFVEKTTRLHHNDRIEIGDAILLFYLEDPDMSRLESSQTIAIDRMKQPAAEPPASRRIALSDEQHLAASTRELSRAALHLQAEMALQVRFADGHQLRIKLDKPEFTIGRAPENDLQVFDEELSRRHMKISLRNNTYYVEDLDSANGTYVNGRITDNCIVRHADQVTIGDTQLKLVEIKA